MRTVLALLYPGIQLLDAIGPIDVFAAANTLRVVRRDAPPAYEIVLASPGGRSVRASNGVAITPDRSLRSIPKRIDTLLVPGTLRLDDVLPDREIVAWIRRAAERARRVASVCSGAFLLAEAGLLDGRRATTHWSGCQQLAERYPRVEVQHDPIFVRDGSIYTSAGVTAGLDLALALVEEDLGREVALEVARWLVMYLRRSGGQAQFSAQLARQVSEREPIREAQHWIEENPEADLRVHRLAKRAGMSPRHFARVFTAELGTTPARYVAAIRLEAARRSLEQSREPLKSIAADSGYASVESLRRAFQQALRTTPGDYRRHFRNANHEQERRT